MNVLATLVNVALDYLLIFGKAGFPELGVTGAALGTVLSQVAGAAVYLAVILGRENRADYGTLAGWRLEPWLVLGSSASGCRPGCSMRSRSRRSRCSW